MIRRSVRTVIEVAGKRHFHVLKTRIYTTGKATNRGTHEQFKQTKTAYRIAG